MGEGGGSGNNNSISIIQILKIYGYV
jgi:hypothetical protein